MTPLEVDLRYAARGWPVFLCRSTEPGRKRPLTGRGFHDATTDTAIITTWRTTWPDALVAVPTGIPIGAVVLDIDTKDDATNGFDTLEDLGHAILPETPMVHTPSGGLHVYFANPERELKCSAGLIGPGLDIRSTGGYVIVPSPGSGYTWDTIHNFKTRALAPAPDWLWPPKPSRAVLSQPQRAPAAGLSPYGKAAIESACTAIVNAPAGEQERTLNCEAYSIGTLAGAGHVPADLALRELLRAGNSMPDHDARWPWRLEEIDLKVRRAFDAGLRNPRESRRAVAA